MPWLRTHLKKKLKLSICFVSNRIQQKKKKKKRKEKEKPHTVAVVMGYAITL